jgi:hypothetical protein
MITKEEEEVILSVIREFFKDENEGFQVWDYHVGHFWVSRHYFYKKMKVGRREQPVLETLTFEPYLHNKEGKIVRKEGQYEIAVRVRGEKGYRGYYLAEPSAYGMLIGVNTAGH